VVLIQFLVTFEGNAVKIVMAMSGGVDSSVAAALLREQGHQVIGATMQLWPPAGKKRSNGSGGWCGPGAVEDAGRVARALDIPHHVLNFTDVFTRKVIADFCHEYSLGRTPNPCIRCNQYIKFGALLERARELGADFIATGHHARIEEDKATGSWLLKKGVDERKEQSYFLYSLTQEQLSHALFPIGNLTKDEVRQIAGKKGLPVADRPESQEICFINDNNYAEFLKDYIPAAARPGPILDEEGNTLGEHRGIMSYTIGQRKGLGIAASRPLYVTAVEPERNAVVVGTKEQTYSRELIATDLNWISMARPERSISIKARVRYRHPEAEAEVTPLDDSRVHVKFTEPQMAITPGQAVVFYDGDIVAGGGIINSRG
jgi:tRNA-specific 2-thiouridylase